MKHLCHTRQGGGEWSHCCICDGRIHEEGCTSKRDKNKDCCTARHKMLYEQGHERGISDDSQAMWSADMPLGYHDPAPAHSDTPD